MFVPPRCPHRNCPRHTDPQPRFCSRWGSYSALCRSHRVPRFKCHTCRRTFSRQTFRVNYRDHRPDLNAKLFALIASGIGIRQSSRTLGLSLRCTELKLRKLARHLRHLNLNLRGPLQGKVASLHFDEIETYEGQRNTRPLSVPILIDSQTRFLVWAESAPIRPRGTMTEKRKKAITEAERRHGRRNDLSRRAIARTLDRGAQLVVRASKVIFNTDEKLSYPRLAEDAYGVHRLEHHKTNSKVARMAWNPLFPINHEEAVMRDLVGRLRRDSWLVSKHRRYLDLGLQIHIAYRNYVRKRFNYDRESPAQMLGFTPRRLKPRELLTWRQDHGEQSIHPLSRQGRKSVKAALLLRLAA